MTKQELIKKTEYTESDLIALALLIADDWARKHRNIADDNESFDHYNDLHAAFEAIRNEMNGVAE